MDGTWLVLGAAGSLRAASYNRALLRAAGEVMPAGSELRAFDLAGIPFYDGDIEAAGDPEPVTRWKEAISQADALLLATPEYNSGTTGLLKNALDWASRPPFGSPLGGKLVAVMGASTGRGGTRRAQAQVRQTLEFPRAVVLDQPAVTIGEAHAKFDGRGRLVDAAARQSVRELLEALIDACRVSPGRLALSARPA